MCVVCVEQVIIYLHICTYTSRICINKTADRNRQLAQFFGRQRIANNSETFNCSIYPNKVHTRKNLLVIFFLLAKTKLLLAFCKFASNQFDACCK